MHTIPPDVAPLLPYSIATGEAPLIEVGKAYGATAKGTATPITKPFSNDTSALSFIARLQRFVNLQSVSRLVQDNIVAIVFLLGTCTLLVSLGLFVFDPLPWRAWGALLIVTLTLVTLVGDLFPTAGALLAALVALLALGAVSPQAAVAGFSNTGVLSVAALYPVAAGIHFTSTLAPALRLALAKPKPLWVAQLRLFIPMAPVSAFLNNTPLIAILMPVVSAWCARVGLHPAYMLMPMNDVAVLGGTLSLLGTSTNLVVDGLTRESGLLTAEDGTSRGIPIFGITGVGLAAFIAGLIYIVIATPRLLRKRPLSHTMSTSSSNTAFYDATAYAARFVVQENGPLIGEYASAAAPGAHIVAVERDGKSWPAKTPLLAGDIVRVRGDAAVLASAYRSPGMRPDSVASTWLPIPRHKRCLAIAVVSGTSKLRNSTAIDSAFCTRFDGAVVALRSCSDGDSEDDSEMASCESNDATMSRAEDQILHAGDSLLVETDEGFVTRECNVADFAVVTDVVDSQPPREDMAHRLIAGAIVIMMIVIAACGFTSLFISATVAGFTLIMTGCLSARCAVRSINISILVTIASSFGIANALDATGAAEQLAKVILNFFSPFGRTGLLVGVYVSAAFLSAVITNNAAAALLFPVVKTILNAQPNVSVHMKLQVLYTLMMGSMGCSSPIAYQTNMMVHGPGGYTFLDWVVFGVPLQIIVGIVTVSVLSFVTLSM